MIQRLLIALIAVIVITASGVAPADAGERNLFAKSANVTATEVNGLGAPDASFIISSQQAPGNASIQQLATVTIDQGSEKIVERSEYCSTGCSNGCSTGCSVGCSVGCSSGCSMGCR
jgi:hypothetical protein